MKVESRGKYPGVKLHLDPEEVNILLDYFNTEEIGVYTGPGHPADQIEALMRKMDKKIRKLLDEDPDLLADRSPEKVKAVHEAQLAELEQEIARLREELTDLRLCLDGVKHDPRCCNHFMGDIRGDQCLRCDSEDARAEVDRLRRERDALREAHLQAAKKFASVLEEEAELSDRLRRERDALREALATECTCRLIEKCERCEAIDALASTADAPPRDPKE